MAFDILDLASRYAQNRLDQAMMPIEDPEEYWRRRMREQGIDIGGGTTAASKPVTQTLKTDPQTGEQELTIKGTPQDLSPANPLTPTVSAVRPEAVIEPTQYRQPEATQVAALAQPQMPAPQPVMPAPAAIPQTLQQPQQAAPVSPEYMARIQQAESGNRPTIGAHGPASSAYGPYGMTNAAWQDAQRANPALAGVPKEQATPAQMTQGMSAYTQQNARALQGYGIEPTQNNLAAAHFLGAKGLNDYLSTGYISPAAARVNGGEDNVRRIVDQRLAGGMAPASGALAQQPVPQTIDDKVLSAQSQAQKSGDLKPIAQLMADKNAGPVIQQVAADITYTNLAQKENEAKAARYVQEKIQDPKGAIALSRELAKQSEEGSYIKAYLFARLGLNDLAKDEQRKLGAGAQWMPSTVDGEQVWVKYNADGAPIKGYSSKGELTPQQLLEAPANMSKAEVGAQMYRDQFTGELYGVRRVNGQVQLVNSVTGRVMTDPAVQKRLIPDTTGGNLALQNALQLQKLRNQLVNIPAQEQAKFIAKFNAEHGTNYPLNLSVTAPAPMMYQEGTAPTTPGAAPAPAAPAATPAAQAVSPQQLAQQAAAAPAATPAAQAVSPQQLAQQAAAAPAATPAATPVPTPSTPLPGESPQEFAKRKEREQSAAKITTEAAPKAESESRKKMVDESSKILQSIPDVASMVESIDKAVGIIDSGEHNIGPAGGLLKYAIPGEKGSNLLPGERQLGQFMGTTDAKNTSTVMDTVNKLAADGLKSLGSNPSTVDLQFWTKNKPNENSSPEFVKDWIQTRSKNLQDRIAFHRQVVEGKGAVPPATPKSETPTKKGEGAGGWRVLSVKPGKKEE